MPEKSTSDKERISITVDKTLLEWLDKEVKTKRFGNRSHGVEVALKIIKKKVEKGERIEYD
ncbi:MAG: ribbon-helix-helix domain-containing protein [Promethearchaeota archaeon]